MKSKPMARSDDGFRQNLTAEQNKAGFYSKQVCLHIWLHEFLTWSGGFFSE